MGMREVPSSTWRGPELDAHPTSDDDDGDDDKNADGGVDSGSYGGGCCGGGVAMVVAMKTAPAMAIITSTTRIVMSICRMQLMYSETV